VATLHLGANAAHTANGWQGAITWVVKAHAPGPIVAQGQLMQGDYPPVWFQQGTHEPTTEVNFDLTQPGAGSSTEYNRFPMLVSFPQAGCYQITVNWYTGSWSEVMSVGR